MQRRLLQRGQQGNRESQGKFILSGLSGETFTKEAALEWILKENCEFFKHKKRERGVKASRTSSATRKACVWKTEGALEEQGKVSWQHLPGARLSRVLIIKLESLDCLLGVALKSHQRH